MFFEIIFDAYPYKNQGENLSDLMIGKIYKSVVTGQFLKYHIQQEDLYISRNCEVVKISKSE